MKKLLAPNGKPSNLTPEQYKLVRTPEFKAWFGDWEKEPENASKVVDENGEPLVVYHSTNKDFNVFEEGKNTIGTFGRGIYFANSKDYASDYNRGVNQKILVCFLNITNPITIKDKLMPIGYENFSVDKMNDNKGHSRDFTIKAKSENYNGVIAELEYGDIEFVAFNPSQIKLADGSNTKFDKVSLDIRYATGGIVSSSKLFMPKVRGGWTKDKIIRYFKLNGSDTSSTITLHKYISEFNNWKHFKEHIYYHGTQNYIERGIKPSITMSESKAERYGGGGYGNRYFGISLTKRKRTAESFSGMSTGVTIYPVILKRDAKVIDRTDLKDASEIEDIIVELYENGVDAVWIGGGEEELVVVNPFSVILYSKGSERHSVFGGFKSIPLTDEKIKETYDNSLVLFNKYTEEYKTKQSKDERNDFTRSLPSIQFDKGGNIGNDFKYTIGGL